MVYPNPKLEPHGNRAPTQSCGPLFVNVIASLLRDDSRELRLLPSGEGLAAPPLNPEMVKQKLPVQAKLSVTGQRRSGSKSKG